MIIFGLVLLLELTLATQRNDIILYRQLEVVPIHSGQLSFKHDVILVLINIDAGIPGASRARRVVVCAVAIGVAA